MFHPSTSSLPHYHSDPPDHRPHSHEARRRAHKRLSTDDVEQGLAHPLLPRSRGGSPSRSTRPSTSNSQRGRSSGEPENIFSRARRIISDLFDSDTEREIGPSSPTASTPRYRTPATFQRSRSRSKSPRGSSKSRTATAASVPVAYDPDTNKLYLGAKKDGVSLPSLRQVVVGSIVCAATFFGAEIIRQVFLERVSVLSLHWSRVLTMAVFGLLFKGPSLVFFYRFLDGKFPGKTTQALATKMAIDLGPWAWFQNWAFLWYACVMDGTPWGAALSLALHQLLPLQLTAYRVWIPAHLVNHKFVQTKFKVLYVNVIGLLWTVALCALSTTQAMA